MGGISHWKISHREIFDETGQELCGWRIGSDFYLKYPNGKSFAHRFYTSDPGDRHSEQIKRSSCYIDKWQRFTIGKLALVIVRIHNRKETTFLAAQTWAMDRHDPTEWREVWTNIQKNGKQWSYPVHNVQGRARDEGCGQPMNSNRRTPPWSLDRTRLKRRNKGS
jgi:hypothetical protein